MDLITIYRCFDFFFHSLSDIPALSWWLPLFRFPTTRTRSSFLVARYWWPVYLSFFCLFDLSHCRFAFSKFFCPEFGKRRYRSRPESSIWTNDCLNRCGRLGPASKPTIKYSLLLWNVRNPYCSPGSFVGGPLGRQQGRYYRGWDSSCPSGVPLSSRPTSKLIFPLLSFNVAGVPSELIIVSTCTSLHSLKHNTSTETFDASWTVSRRNTARTGRRCFFERNTQIYCPSNKERSRLHPILLERVRILWLLE